MSNQEQGYSLFPTIKMGRKSCSKEDGSVNRGVWSAEEDEVLKRYVETHGPSKWGQVSRQAGLNRGSKSCRLRWMNYLRPGIKRGNICEDEEDLILRMHKLIGNRWSLIAGRLPGRTDNEIKNHWNCYLSKKFLSAKSNSSNRTHRLRGESNNKEVDHISGKEDEQGLLPFRIGTNGDDIAKIPSASSSSSKDCSNSDTFLADLEMYLNDHDLQTSTDIENDFHLTEWINELCEDGGDLQQEKSDKELCFLADGTQKLQADWNFMQ